MKLLSTLCFFLGLILHTLPGQSLEQKIPSDKLKMDLQILKKNLETVHAGLYNYHSEAEWDVIFKNLESNITSDLNSMDFYARVGKLIELIGDVHTEIEPPEIFYDSLNQVWPVFPISVQWVNEKLYTLWDFSEEHSIPVGSEILSINKLSSKEIFESIRSYVPRDGYNLTSPSHSLSGIFGQFRNYYAALYGRPSIFELELKLGDGQLQSRTIKARPYQAIFDQFEAQRSLIPKSKKDRDLTFELKGNTGILSVQSFHPGQIKENGQQFKAFFKQAFKQLQEANANRLILDLRGNGGGHESVFIELFRYLTDQPFQVYKRLYTITNKIPNPAYYLEQRAIKMVEKELMKTTIHEEDLFLLKPEIGTKVIKPKPNPFKGDLIVLIDGKSSSAAGDFTGLLKANSKAVFVGEEAGGNPYINTAGTSFTLVLPNSGLQIIIPTLAYEIKLEGVNKGRGMLPDYPISPSISDIIQNKDVVLEFALSLKGN